MIENNQFLFKEANIDELSFVLDLYNYYILNSTATFDYETITMEELQVRLSYENKKYRTFLICDTTEKNVIGFCFLKQFRKKPAYDRTAEIGVYLKPDSTGKKIGQLIIRFLEEYAKENQIEAIIAIISSENVNSIKLFEKTGYERCAHYKEIAIKFNRHLDLLSYEKILG
jgi:phosphinothricin acetyltransferase